MPPHAHDHHHGHAHESGHSHAHGHGSSRAIGRAMAVTAVFMALELAGGWYANSLALISDGAHMLTDLGAMAFSLVAIWIARKPRTAKMSFGYQRAEILGALASGLAIWLIAGALVWEAVQRLRAPEEVHGPVVFVIATIGLVANLVSMKFLHHAQHDNLNARAAYLHLMSDTIGSVGAIVAGAVLWATGWQPIDPIVTLLFSALMVASSWTLIKETVAVLMESSPAHIDPEQVERDLLALESVVAVHDLHIWSVSSGTAALSVHLISSEEPARPPRNLLARARAMLREKHGIDHTTLQIESPESDGAEPCEGC